MANRTALCRRSSVAPALLPYSLLAIRYSPLSGERAFIAPPGTRLSLQ
jgi:hypothetical protein